MSGNAALYFMERHVIEGRGKRPAFRKAAGLRRSMSYAALAQASGHVVGALAAAGIPREARAAMLVLDQIEFPQIFWGCIMAGVVPVPLNTLLATSVYETILKDSRANCLFVSAQLWPVVQLAAHAAPQLEHVAVIGDAPEGMQSFDAFLDPAPFYGCRPLCKRFLTA